MCAPAPLAGLVHSTIGGKHFYRATSQPLQRARDERSFRSAVWASERAVRMHWLQRQNGDAPAAHLSIDGRSVGFYNTDQLIALGRTATGALFPLALMRPLRDAQLARHFKASQWFDAGDLRSLRLLPGQAPIAVEARDGQRVVVVNADQLAEPDAVHSIAVADGRYVASWETKLLEHVRQARGFTATTWVPVNVVGLKPGVEPVSTLAGNSIPNRVYNTDQLEWPVAVPDPPHTWPSGRRFRPHEQQVLAAAAATHGFTSRTWHKPKKGSEVSTFVVLTLYDGTRIRVVNEDLLGPAAPVL
jgi:hypothetical protein